jgi:peptidyl-prolyl cis-trans isomerase A (cyclophilin A)
MKTIILSCLFTLTLLAQAPANTNKYPAKRPATPAAPTGASNARLMNPAALKAVAPALYKVQFTTTKGDFVVEVHRDWAPLGADRFYNLVRNGFFTNASFFRVIEGFMAQFGINANPAVSKVWMHANIKDDPVKQSNKKGYITFATAGPNTRTTQLFINLADNGRLDPSGFAPFGMVVDGMDVVEKIYSGYGEGAPDGRGPEQQKVQDEGKAYLDKNFPQLDSIKSAKILPAEGAAPAK